ncbi:general substrate transporter [Rhypophila sp. PSN 637]
MGAAEQQDRVGLKDHWRCLAAMTLVSLSAFQYGLDFGVISGLQAMVPFLEVFGYPDPEAPGGWNISSERQQLISSLMTLGAFISSASAGLSAVIVGRRTSIWIACLFSILSTVMMQVTTGIGVLYAARLIIGLANGVFTTHSQLWILECSPARYRGLAISGFQIWTTVGTLIGTIINNFLSFRTDKSAYIIPLGIVYIIPGILAIGLLFVPESPRWLLAHSSQPSASCSAAAEKALAWLRPKGWDVGSELAEIQTAIENERQLHSGLSVFELVNNPVDRRRTLLSIGVVLCQASSGSMFIIAFGTYFFLNAGIGTPFQDSVIMIATGVVAIIINSAVITRFGYRRRMLMTGMVLCGLCQLLVAVVWDTRAVPLASGSTLDGIVALTVIYMFIYTLCISAYAWLSGGEIPSQRLRSHTFGLATAFGFFGAWLITFTAPYFINPAELNWGPKYGYIWFGSCFLSAIWLFLCLPETKNRTLEEIDEMFHARVPTRKFGSYRCVASTSGGTSKEQNTVASTDETAFTGGDSLTSRQVPHSKT